MWSSFPLLTLHVTKILQCLMVILNSLSYSSIVTKCCFTGALMTAECHIWVPVYVFLTSTWYNHFQWIYLTAVHWNVVTTTQVRNKNHPSRVYLLHPSIHIKSVANIFGCFQLDIDYPFCSLKTTQTWMSCHQL